MTLLETSWLGGYATIPSDTLSVDGWSSGAAAAILSVLLFYYSRTATQRLSDTQNARRALCWTGCVMASIVAIVTIYRNMVSVTAIWMTDALTPYVLALTAVFTAVIFGGSSFKPIHPVFVNGTAISFCGAVALYIFQFYAGAHIDWNLCVAVFFAVCSAFVVNGKINGGLAANGKLAGFSAMLFAVWVVLSPYSAMEIRASALLFPLIWIVVSENGAHESVAAEHT